MRPGIILILRDGSLRLRVVYSERQVQHIAHVTQLIGIPEVLQFEIIGSLDCYIENCVITLSTTRVNCNGCCNGCFFLLGIIIAEKLAGVFQSGFQRIRIQIVCLFYTDAEGIIRSLYEAV